MKKVRFLCAFALVLLLIFQTVGIIASAEPTAAVKPGDMQKSVVYIETQCKYVSQNAGISFSASFGGTGFAIGVVGDPVQYIATCAHVVEQPNGMYKVVYNTKTGEKIYTEKVNDGVVPTAYSLGSLTVLYDYFDVKATSVAYFSYATQDMALLSILESNYERDVAICRIATPVPVTKLEARPLLMRTEEETGKENVFVGDTVYAIGYPGTATYEEARFDYSDSVVTKGVISKIQLTTGANGSKQQFYSFMIDANTTHGNSGGPLFTEDGCVIGLNAFLLSSKYSDNPTPANYAIAVEEVVKLIRTARIPCTILNNKDELATLLQQTELTESAETTAAESTTAAETTEPVTQAEPVNDNTNSTNTTNVLLIILIVLAIVLLAVVLLRRKKNGAKDGGAANKTEPGKLSHTKMGNTPRRAESLKDNKTIVASVNMYLHGVSGPLTGKKYRIEHVAFIGTDSSKCQIVFPEGTPGVSGKHCKVFCNGDKLSVQDCESSYGTYLQDGTKVSSTEPSHLQSGDRFIVGDTDNVFEVEI